MAIEANPATAGAPCSRRRASAPWPRLSNVRALAGWFALLSLSAGCATQVPPKVGSSAPAPAAPIEHGRPRAHEKKQIPRDIVERSALPFQAWRASDTAPLAPTEFFDALAETQAVCIGEQHDNPHDHWAELSIVQEVAKRAVTSGREFALGLEMFQAPFQKYLDQYASGKIDEAEMLEQTEYDDRWGYPFAYYAPQIELTVARGGEVLALNAPREQTKRVAHQGFKALSPRELRLLGGYDLDSEAHRAQFDALMKDHPAGMGSPEHLYRAQVLWDESMAQAAAQWLSARFPARQLVVLAGAAHCYEPAIPERLKRRLSADVVNVLPLIVKEPDPDPAEIARKLAGYDYGFIMSPHAL